MEDSRFRRHERIKAVEREYLLARIAFDRLAQAAATDPMAIGTDCAAA